MKAVIYARYSDSNQREESIEGQLRECGYFAKRKGFTVVKTYADRAISGKKADNRPHVLCCRGCSIPAPTLQHGNPPVCSKSSEVANVIC